MTVNLDYKPSFSSDPSPAAELFVSYHFRRGHIMRQYIALPASALLAYTLSISAATAPRPGVDWPQFRGISANGVAEGFSVPVEWNVAAGTNVAWKADVPGLGLASPIVWGDTVFVSTSISGRKDAGLKVGYYGNVEPVQDDTEHEWQIYALDKKSGKVKWQQTVMKAVPKI